MSESEEQRIQREEEHWTAPRLFVLGFVSLAIAIAILMIAANAGIGHG